MSDSWRISDDTAFVVSSPERVVLLNLAVVAAQPIGLLGTGAAVWRALVGQEDDLRPWVSEVQLLEQLADDFGTEPAAIEPDVTALLRRLADEGYVASGASPTRKAAAEPRPVPTGASGGVAGETGLAR